MSTPKGLYAEDRPWKVRLSKGDDPAAVSSAEHHDDVCDDALMVWCWR